MGVIEGIATLGIEQHRASYSRSEIYADIWWLECGDLEDSYDLARERQWNSICQAGKG